MGPSSGPREIRLSTTPDKAELDALELGDIVWLDGLIYTAREGVYMRALDEGARQPPLQVDDQYITRLRVGHPFAMQTRKNSPASELGQVQK